MLWRGKKWGGQRGLTGKAGFQQCLHLFRCAGIPVLTQLVTSHKLQPVKPVSLFSSVTTPDKVMVESNTGVSSPWDVET